MYNLFIYLSNRYLNTFVYVKLVIVGDKHLQYAVQTMHIIDTDNTTTNILLLFLVEEHGKEKIPSSFLFL